MEFFILTTIIFAVLFVLKYKQLSKKNLEISSLKSELKKSQGNAQSNPNQDYRKRIKFELTGSQNEDFKQHLWNLKEKEALTLRFDADNKYDKEAIAVYYHQFMIGFVPKSHQKAVSKQIAVGNNTVFVDKVVFWSPPENPNKTKIYVKVYLPY